MILKKISKFFLGFLFGLIIELIAVELYKKIDPKSKSDLKLLIVVIIQLYCIIAIIEYASLTDDLYSRIGILSSQLFVFDYALKRFYTRIQSQLPFRVNSVTNST